MISLNVNVRDQAIRRAMVPMMKKSLLTKMSKINHSIGYLYNETMRTLFSAFIVNTVRWSKEQEREKSRIVKELNQLKVNVSKIS